MAANATSTSRRAWKLDSDYPERACKIAKRMLHEHPPEYCGTGMRSAVVWTHRASSPPSVHVAYYTPTLLVVRQTEPGP